MSKPETVTVNLEELQTVLEVCEDLNDQLDSEEKAALFALRKAVVRAMTHPANQDGSR